jgi:putative zinc finger protein
MNTDAFTDRLSDYLDDELSAAERASVEAHLGQCEACRTTVEELRAVVARAAALPDSRPDRELWSGIAVRIAQPGARISPFRRAVTARLSFTLPQVAAASLTLMVLSGGLVWMARSGDRRADIPPVNAQVADDMPVTRARFADEQYDAAVAELKQTLDAGRAKLDPETVHVLEQNLAAIDRAIDQCRRALDGDPANVYLNTHLADARQRKLALLRRAAALTGGT